MNMLQVSMHPHKFLIVVASTCQKASLTHPCNPVLWELTNELGLIGAGVGAAVIKAEQQ